MISHYLERAYQGLITLIKMDIELIESINKDLAIELPENIRLDEAKEKLKQYINDLIQHDFEKLVSTLYRIDVNEAKLKQVLQHNPEVDAANIITQLIIERELQKIKTRRQFKQEDNNSEEEKW